jgi:hypothetical protein
MAKDIWNTVKESGGFYSSGANHGSISDLNKARFILPPGPQ